MRLDACNDTGNFKRFKVKGMNGGFQRRQASTDMPMKTHLVKIESPYTC